MPAQTQALDRIALFASAQLQSIFAKCESRYQTTGEQQICIVVCVSRRVRRSTVVCALSKSRAMFTRGKWRLKSRSHFQSNRSIDDGDNDLCTKGRGRLPQVRKDEFVEPNVEVCLLTRMLSSAQNCPFTD